MFLKNIIVPVPFYFCYLRTLFVIYSYIFLLVKYFYLKFNICCVYIMLSLRTICLLAHFLQTLKNFLGKNVLIFFLLNGRLVISQLFMVLSGKNVWWLVAAVGVVAAVAALVVADIADVLTFSSWASFVDLGVVIKDAENFSAVVVSLAADILTAVVITVTFVTPCSCCCACPCCCCRSWWSNDCGCSRMVMLLPQSPIVLQSVVATAVVVAAVIDVVSAEVLPP